MSESSKPGIEETPQESPNNDEAQQLNESNNGNGSEKPVNIDMNDLNLTEDELKELQIESEARKNQLTVIEEPVSWPVMKQTSTLNLGSLLRLFKSDFFDTWMGVSYLYRYPSRGVHDYLINQLFSMPLNEVEFYLVELITMLVHAEFETDALERFILDKCSKSIHFALLVSWLLLASVEDSPQSAKTCEKFLQKCEQAVVHGSDWEAYTSSHSRSDAHARVEGVHVITSGQELTASELAASASAQLELYSSPKLPAHRRSKSMMEMDDMSWHLEALSKRDRSDYFNKIMDFVDELGRISDRLRLFPVPNRQKELEKEMRKLTRNLPVGLYLPLWDGTHKHFSIVRLVPQEARVLKSRERCPYIMYFESLESEHTTYSENLHNIANEYIPVVDRIKKLKRNHLIEALKERKSAAQESSANGSPSPLSSSTPSSGSSTPKKLSDSIGLVQTIHSTMLAASGPGSLADSTDLSGSQDGSSSVFTSVSLSMSSSFGDDDEEDEDCPFTEEEIRALEEEEEEKVSHLTAEEEEQQKTYTTSPFGEPWKDKQERTRRRSEYGCLPNWKLNSVIVKFGDDCRQEYMALQLIAQFKKIFDDAQLPLWLKPYRILVNSPSSGLIETLTDSVSIHGLKKFYDQDPPITLAEHFRRTYGAPDSHDYRMAVSNFTESLAGYSLVSYLLQIKDRHNGNLMIDREGHIIHIDFGFMLSNSPGNFNPENVPFKLTQEFVEVMGGLDSGMFYYFKALLTRGYLEVRKHCEKIVLLIEMMAIGSKLPCFYAGQLAISALRERFNVCMTEEQVTNYIEGMVLQSYNNWRTRYYDRFQYLTNGIIP